MSGPLIRCRDPPATTARPALLTFPPVGVHSLCPPMLPALCSLSHTFTVPFARPASPPTDRLPPFACEWNLLHSLHWSPLITGALVSFIADSVQCALHSCRLLLLFLVCTAFFTSHSLFCRIHGRSADASCQFSFTISLSRLVQCRENRRSAPSHRILCCSLLPAEASALSVALFVSVASTLEVLRPEIVSSVVHFTGNPKWAHTRLSSHCHS